MPEKVRNWILPWSLRRRQPCPHLDFHPGNEFLTSDFQSCKRTHLDGFKPLLSWSFATAATGHTAGGNATWGGDWGVVVRLSPQTRPQKPFPTTLLPLPPLRPPLAPRPPLLPLPLPPCSSPSPPPPSPPPTPLLPPPSPCLVQCGPLGAPARLLCPHHQPLVGSVHTSRSSRKSARCGSEHAMKGCRLPRTPGSFYLP